MRPYKSIFKEKSFREAGEYNDRETRQFITNIVNLGTTAGKLAKAIDLLIYVEANETSNPEYAVNGYIPDSNNLYDLQNYLHKNQLSKINRRLLYNAYNELTGIEGFYDDAELDITDVRQELELVEKAFEGIF